MKKVMMDFALAGTLLLLVSFGNITGSYLLKSESQQTITKSKQAGTKTDQTSTKATQTSTKTKQAGTKTTQTSSKSSQTSSKPKPSASKTTAPTSKSAKPGSTAEVKKMALEPGSIMIGEQVWAIANLDISTFRNGDSIPHITSNEDWVKAGEAKKPAWCYYNNDPVNGKKYGKLYNWYAVSDPRGLAPEGWSVSDNDDWTKLAYYLKGQELAGTKMKSISGWTGGNNGTNESGFNGLPGGYRVENGTFMNIGSTGIWWSTSESKSLTAFDHYLILSSALARSSSPRQRGESVRCIKR